MTTLHPRLGSRTAHPSTNLARIIGLAAAMLLSACEDPLIDPFVEGQHFTVWGYLSLFESEHFVRVVAVRRFPERIERPGDPHAEIDAEVTSTNLSTGQVLRWTHRLTRLDDGSFGHVFSAKFEPSAGATYRLTVRRSDGAESYAETTIPRGVQAEPASSVIDEGKVTQAIRWKGVPAVDDVNVVYCAAPVGVNACSDGADGGGLLIPYGKKGRRVGNEWEIQVDLSDDFEYLRRVAGLPPELTLQLNSLQMRARVMDENWTLYADPDVFAQPHALNNVVNGFGYWGALGNGLLDWVPDNAALAQLNVVRAN